MDKLLEKIPDWALIGLLISLIIWILVKMKQVFKFFMHALFGEDGADYKELTGAAGFFGFVGFLVKHFLDRTYTPDPTLLYACLGIVTVLAGISKGGDLLDKHLDNKKSNNFTPTKKENDDKKEGMDI